jgi:hypothetical protein
MIATIARVRNLRASLSLLVSLSAAVNDPLRDALQSGVTYFSDRVSWSTYLVFAGVALELIELIHDFIEWLKRRKAAERDISGLREISEFVPVQVKRSSKCKSAAPHSEHWFVKWSTRIGTILVVFGVLGEGWYGIKLEDAHNAVHEYDLAKLTTADEKAGDAAQSANTAKKAAKDAWEYAAWRIISDEQFKQIKEQLVSLRGHTLTIQANPDEAEIWGYANRLNASFGTKGTAALWPQGWIVSPGLTFSIGKNRQYDFEAIVKALDAAGVEKADVLRKKSDHKGVSDNDLILTVGPRH